MPKPWKKLDSSYIVKNKWIDLREDRCLLPDGKIVDDYYVLEYPDWVNIVAITPLLEVVLVQQYRHGIGRVTLELPSGVVDFSDASPLETAKRELLEETGYNAETVVPLSVLSPNPATHSNSVHSFLARGVELVAKQNLDEHEDIEVLLMPLDEVKVKLRQGSFIQSMHTAALYLALSYLN